MPRFSPGHFFSAESAISRMKNPGRIFSAMTVRVLLFASYADAVGRNELTLELEDGSRVADVVDRVREMAGGRALPPSPLLAVNASYAPSSTVIRGGDEVAIIPPVAGG